MLYWKDINIQRFFINCYNNYNKCSRNIQKFKKYSCSLIVNLIEASILAKERIFEHLL